MDPKVLNPTIFPAYVKTWWKEDFECLLNKRVSTRDSEFRGTKVFVGLVEKKVF